MEGRFDVLIKNIDKDLLSNQRAALDAAIMCCRNEDQEEHLEGLRALTDEIADIIYYREKGITTENYDYEGI